MLKRTPSRQNTIGLPPGTLVHVGERKVETPRIQAIVYGPDGFREFETLDEAAGQRGERRVLWVHVSGLRPPAAGGGHNGASTTLRQRAHCAACRGDPPRPYSAISFAHRREALPPP